MKGNLVVGALGMTAQIAPTTSASDCMCWTASGCTGSPGAPCMIGGPNTAVDTTNACAGAAATEDEMSLFVAAFGAHH